MKSKLFLLLLCAVAFTGCSKTEKSSTPSRPTVLTSIPPYAYFIQRIAGDTVDVLMLVPPGIDPHVFEPTPSQVGKASQSSLWLKIGEPFEAKIAPVLKERNPALVQIDLSENSPLLSLDCCGHHAHHKTDAYDGLDRHIWLSPKLAKVQATLIADHLISLFPNHREAYEKGLKEFLEDLKQVDDEITSLLSPLADHAILAAHPAFGYFCQDYHLVQLSIDSDGKDPLPQDLSQTIQRAQDYGVTSIIAQPQYGKKGANALAEKLQLPIFLIDPYSTDYLANLRHLARIIATHDD